MFCPHCGAPNQEAGGPCTACGSTTLMGATGGATVGASIATTVGAPAGQAAAMQGAPATFLPGRSIGNRYVIVRLLGAGGMGAVYQAFDQELGVAIALKIIRQPGGTNDQQATE